MTAPHPAPSAAPVTPVTPVTPPAPAPRRWLAALGLLASLALGACAPPAPEADPRNAAAAPAARPQLRFLGEFRLPAIKVDGMPVGGLSGIDYDAARDRWLLISDDRSQRAPARFFTARIDWNEALGLDVQVDSATVLRRPDGQPFSRGAIDPESLRLMPDGSGVIVASEGLRLRTPRRAFIQPFLREFALDGRHRREFILPPNFEARPDRGPRSNSVFEGTAITPDGRWLWAALESPLLDDDEVPDAERGAWLRFTRFDLKTGQPASQSVYPLSRLPARPWFGIGGGEMFPDVGVSEIAALDDERLLVLERSFVFGHGFVSRLFVADLAGSTDTLAIDSLAGASFVPATKRLLIDLSSLPVARENLEGLAIGPRLRHADGSPGGRLVVLVADDNFLPLLLNQFLAFELLD
ncbi:esterase-like activity of phytase family protein [Derxia lacustris]|uniref:esterase-like activity of phytase family protein n=1 Tax=Derxia lacustris TaxID=764842 RepID=UPI000A16D830|nr:esterase-like activity of phytase family protein [Derxia lacustris]